MDPTATQCLQRDLEACLTFYASPKEHWKTIRTNNVIERLFGAVKRRSHKMAAAFRNEGSCLSLFYAVICSLHFNTTHPVRSINQATGRRDCNEVDSQRGTILSSDLSEIPSDGFMKLALFQPSLPEPDGPLSRHPALQGGGSTGLGLIPLRFAASTAPVGLCPPSPAPLPPCPGHYPRHSGTTGTLSP